MHEPLYTADEMREAEARYPGYPETAPELMERAGAAVAREAMRAFPRARRFAVVCGGGVERRRRPRSRRGCCGRPAATRSRPTELDGADVVIDALFGTGFHGEPRPDAAALIERMNAAGAPIVSVDVPSGVDGVDGRDRRRRRQGRADRDVSRAQGRASSSRRAASMPVGSSWPTSGWSRSPTDARRATESCSGTCRGGRRTIRSTRQAACSSSAARRA